MVDCLLFTIMVLITSLKMVFDLLGTGHLSYETKVNGSLQFLVECLVMALVIRRL